ncbi:MAG TPA: CBS and ACT domain-containing protein [Syntrophomonadaceae bacterium]|nr:CBS and ACT domain-containing protein [Syntrophomonadaceae bacterium]
MKVRDRMSRDVASINLEASVTEAFRIMKEKNIRRLPVLEKEKLVGIITLSDLNQASPSTATSLSIHELNYILARTKIADVIPKKQQLITATPENYIETAARLMLENRISGLPVVEAGELVGIITETDLFRALIDILGVKRPHTRIDTFVPEGPGGLAELTGLIAARGINIINSVVYYDQALDKYKVILRIEELNYQPVVEDLKSRGYDIESVIVNTRVD